MKSLATRIEIFQLGPFTLRVEDSYTLAQGDLIVDILKSALTGTCCFLIWVRTLKDDPRCDGCVNHSWTAIRPSPSSPAYQTIGEAKAAAARYVVAERIEGSIDLTTS